MTATTCEHAYELESVQESPHGGAQRLAVFTCSKCGEQIEKHTTKTDAELAAELAAQ